MANDTENSSSIVAKLFDKKGPKFAASVAWVFTPGRSWVFPYGMGKPMGIGISMWYEKTHGYGKTHGGMGKPMEVQM